MMLAHRRTGLEGDFRGGHPGGMDDGIGPALRAIARTGLLVAALGLALYAIIAFVAELPQAPWLISLALAAPLSALTGFVAVEALRKGYAPSMHGAVDRRQRPLDYWSLTAVYLAASLLLAALAIWAALRLAFG